MECIDQVWTWPMCVCVCMYVRVCACLCVYMAFLWRTLHPSRKISYPCTQNRTLEDARTHTNRQTREPSVRAPTHTHMFTPAHPRAHSRTHARIHTNSLSHTHTHTRAHNFPLSLFRSFSCPGSLPRTLAPSLSAWHSMAFCMADLLADGSRCLGARAGALGKK